MDNTTSTALGFRLELRGDVWVVQYDTRGCHPATPDELKLWLALEAAEAELRFAKSELDIAERVSQRNADAHMAEMAHRKQAQTELTRRDEELRISERYRRIYQSRANERAEELNVLGDANASLKEQLTQKVPEEFQGLWRRIANQRRSLRVLHRWNEMLNRWGDDQAIELQKLRLAAAPVSLEAVKAETTTEQCDGGCDSMFCSARPLSTEGGNRV